MSDPWAQLGIERGATRLEIKRAYAERLKVTRPDDDPEAFRRLRDAYEWALSEGELDDSSVVVDAGLNQQQDHDTVLQGPGRGNAETASSTGGMEPNARRAAVKRDAESLFSGIGRDRPKAAAKSLNLLLDSDKYQDLMMRADLEATLVEMSSAQDEPPYDFIRALATAFRWNERTHADPYIESMSHQLVARFEAHTVRETFERRMPLDPIERSIGRLLLGERPKYPEAMLSRSRGHLRAFVDVTTYLVNQCPFVFEYEFDTAVLTRWASFTNSRRLTFDDVGMSIVLSMAFVPFLVIAILDIADSTWLELPPNIISPYLLGLSVIAAALGSLLLRWRPRTPADHRAYPRGSTGGAIFLIVMASLVFIHPIMEHLKSVLSDEARELWSLSTWTYWYVAALIGGSMIAFMLVMQVAIERWSYAVQYLAVNNSKLRRRVLTDALGLLIVLMLVVFACIGPSSMTFIVVLGIILFAALHFGSGAFVVIACLGLIGVNIFPEQLDLAGLEFNQAWAIASAMAYILLLFSFGGIEFVVSQLTSREFAQETVRKWVAMVLITVAVVTMIYELATSPPGTY